MKRMWDEKEIIKIAEEHGSGEGGVSKTYVDQQDQKIKTEAAQYTDEAVEGLVEANPEAAGTETLSKLKVGETVYTVGGGAGGTTITVDGETKSTLDLSRFPLQNMRFIRPTAEIEDNDVKITTEIEGYNFNNHYVESTGSNQYIYLPLDSSDTVSVDVADGRIKLNAIGGSGGGLEILEKESGDTLTEAEYTKLATGGAMIQVGETVYMLCSKNANEMVFRSTQPLNVTNIYEWDGKLNAVSQINFVRIGTDTKTVDRWTYDGFHMNFDPNDFTVENGMIKLKR